MGRRKKLGERLKEWLPDLHEWVRSVVRKMKKKGKRRRNVNREKKTGER